MDCCIRREKPAEIRPEQKWDYINLSDFKSTTCFTPLSYGILYISLIISVAVYGVDIFTAANLLFFDRWSGQVTPVIPFRISRWIFATCIVLSWIFLVYRWVRAVRAMRTGVVAASYLDPLAFMIQSIRTGANGRGWRRFLVFAELTKGRNGAEYVALFTYFSFEACLRIVFAEGPRQVINALTLYSVMQANLVPVGEHAPKKGGSAVAQFFINLKILANHNKEQAAILFGMLFTLVIWVIAALSLILAALCYILFLWHYIPADDGLSGYCRRKVDSRLHKIVGVKVKRALAIDLDPTSRRKSKTVRDGATPARVTRQPTFPMLDFDAGDKQNEPPISRRTTETTLPPYSANADDETRGRSKNSVRKELIIPYLPPFQSRPAPSSRTITNSSANSNVSYASNAPLLRAAEEMGYEPSMDSHPAAASFGPSPGHQHPPSIERNFTSNQNGMQRSQDAAFGLPHFQGSKTPDSMLARHAGLQKSRQNDFNFSGAQLHSTKAGGNFGTVQEISRPDRSGTRIDLPSGHQLMGTQDHEVHHPRPTPVNIDQPHDNNGYVAFNPHLRTGVVPRTSATGPTRNFTMPFNRPSPRPAPQHQTASHNPTLASNPPPALLARTPTSHTPSEAPPPRRLPPRRAATTGPGALTWDGSKMFY